MKDSKIGFADYALCRESFVHSTLPYRQWRQTSWKHPVR